KYKITRSLTYPQSRSMQATITGNPWRDWQLLPTYEGGLIGEIVATGEPQVVTGFDLSKDAALLKALGPYATQLHSLTAMPTFDDGQPLNWAISFHEEANWSDLDTFVAGF